VRRAAAKVLAAVICAYPDILVEVYKQVGLAGGGEAGWWWGWLVVVVVVGLAAGAGCWGGCCWGGWPGAASRCN
jgi:hypothetical protein